MFTFLAPLWLLVIPIATGLLLYAYLRHGRNKQRKISSLFFVKQVAPSIARGRQKMALPWRLLFELLVLLALIAAIAGMFFKSASQRIVIVIDNSLSMGAQINPGVSKDSLLDEAKRSASSNLDLFLEISLASVWVTSPSPREISDGFVPSSKAKDLISNIALSFSTGNVSAVLSRLEKKANKTLVFTDQGILPQSSAANPSVRLVPLNVLNPRRENVAIDSVLIDRSIDRDTSNITVKVQSFLTREALCRVVLSKLLDRSWSSLAARDVNLAGIGSKEIIFNLGQEDTGNKEQAFRAQITSCTPDKTNVLSLDDSAWQTSEQGQSQMTLVSEFTSAQLGLNKISSLQIDSKKPLDWEKENSSQNESSMSNLIIFHRYLPKALPKTNALFISPPLGSNLIKVQEIVGATRLVRWEKESPMIRYLTLPDLTLNDSVQFSELPAWGLPLIYSSTGPVAIYGSLAQNRYAAIGFEVLPFEGKSNPFLSILTLNVIKWLSRSGEEMGTSTLSRINLKDAAQKALFVDSTLKNASATLSQSRKSLALSSPGLVDIVYSKGSHLISANFFSATESNLLAPGLVSVSASSSAESQVKDLGLVLEVYLIILALVILLIDSLLFIYRRKRAI